MAKLSVEEPDALMCARPGLREPWVVTPRATRPDALWLAAVTRGAEIDRCKQRQATD